MGEAEVKCRGGTPVLSGRGFPQESWVKMEIPPPLIWRPASAEFAVSGKKTAPGGSGEIDYELA